MNSTAHAPQQRRSIRNYLLDTRFQVKWTGFIVLVTLSVSSVLGIFLYRTSSEVTAQSQQVILQGQELIAESRKNSDLVRITIRKDYEDAPELANSFGVSAGELEAGLQRRHESLLREQKRTLDQQRMMLISLVAGLSILVVLVSLLGIYFTHKVVGPIHKMKGLLRQVGDGHLNVHERLRKGDELQDFFETFAVMVEQLRERQRREVDDLDEAIGAARASGASDEAVARIRAVRDEMSAALNS